MTEEKKKFVDFYNDGENQVLVELDIGTMRWVVYNMCASYIHKLEDRLKIIARGNDRNEAKSQVTILKIFGAQLLQLADAVEKGPPEEYTVQLVTEK